MMSQQAFLSLPFHCLHACSVPSLLVSGTLRMVRSSVLKKAGLDIYDLRPIQHAASSFVPAVSGLDLFSTPPAPSCPR